MDEVRTSIGDGGVLALVEAFLKEDIVEGLAHGSPETGAPRGAVISPLPSNVYFHSIDITMRAGFPWCSTGPFQPLTAGSPPLAIHPSQAEQAPGDQSGLGPQSPAQSFLSGPWALRP